MENGNSKIIKLAGGIGNQLFQYCFGQFMKYHTKCDTFYFHEYGYQNSHAADITNVLPIQLASNKTLREHKYYFTNRWHYRIIRKLNITFPWLRKDVLTEIGSRYIKNIDKFYNYKVFDGYWQSYRYLQPIENDIRSTIDFSQYIPFDYMDIKDKDNTVFIHMRRGDYTKRKNRNLFHSCTKEYFSQAINIITEKIENPIFYIFSNDKVWANDVLEGLDVTIVFPEYKVPEKNADYYDLALMASCKNAIISNSTYSWWGAWLIKNDKKIVIAPKKWYNKTEMNNNTVDLIPQEWIRI